MKTIGHGYYWNDLDVGFKFRTLNRTIIESDLVGFINRSLRQMSTFHRPRPMMTE
jgi:hypothetical protein